MTNMDSSRLRITKEALPALYHQYYHIQDLQNALSKDIVCNNQIIYKIVREEKSKRRPH